MGDGVHSSMLGGGLSNPYNGTYKKHTTLNASLLQHMQNAQIQQAQNPRYNQLPRVTPNEQFKEYIGDTMSNPNFDLEQFEQQVFKFCDGPGGQGVESIISIKGKDLISLIALAKVGLIQAGKMKPVPSFAYDKPSKPMPITNPDMPKEIGSATHSYVNEVRDSVGAAEREPN